MSTHLYPRDALRADYLRAGAGMALAMIPFAFGEPGRAASVFLFVIAALFGVFALRTLAKQRLVLRLTEDELIAEGGLVGRDKKKIGWEALRALHLRYYATGRDRKQGWMHLTLKNARETIRLESTLVDFDAVLGRAARAAVDNDLLLTPTTRANLHARGIETKVVTPPPGDASS